MPIRMAARLTAVVAVTCAAALTLVGPAQAKQVRTPVHNHYDDHGTAVPATDFTCPARSGAVSSQALKSGPFVIGTGASDNWVGTATVKVCIYFMPDDTWQYVGTETDTATHATCGHGTVTWGFVGVISAPRADGTRTDDGAWAIIPGSGSGDFADITGGAGTYGGTIAGGLQSAGAWQGNVWC